MSYLHATDKEIYQNFVILHPDTGEKMCYCDEKKINWYLKRGLAKRIDEKTIQLLFTPAGKGNIHLSKAFETNRSNVCVVCGTDKNLTKHHVVPYQYRKHFPLVYKSNNHFDILAVCVAHHEEYEREADRLNLLLNKECGICTKGNMLVGAEVDAFKIRKLINALIANSQDIPATRRDIMLKKIGAFFNVGNVDMKSLPSLSMHLTQEVPKLVPAALIVANSKDVNAFIVRWRRHFLETMKPQFMTSGWVEESELFFYGKD